MFPPRLMSSMVLWHPIEVLVSPVLVFSYTEDFTLVFMMLLNHFSQMTGRIISVLILLLDGVSPSSLVSFLTPLIPSEEEWWWWPLAKPSSTLDPSTAHNRSLLRKVLSPSSRVLALTWEVSLVLVSSQVTTTSSLRSTQTLSPPPSDPKYPLPFYFLLSFYQNSEGLLSSMFFVFC